MIFILTFMLIMVVILIAEFIKKRISFDEFSFGFFILLLCVSIFLIFPIVGGEVYPQLKAKNQEIRTLEKNIGLIKNSYYKNSLHSLNSLLMNHKQSSNLSSFLQKIAEKKAKYNLLLVETQEKKESILYNLVSYYFFVDGRVSKMEILE